MISVQSMIDGKFLSLCPAAEAVAWLKEGSKRHRFLYSTHEYEEHILAARNDQYIDFGLAKYGRCEKACKQVYERGDRAIKLTFLANFPKGGFELMGRYFLLSDQPPNEAEELQALLMNPLLPDEIFMNCFEQKGIFANLTEEEFQNVLLCAGENERLSTPPDKYMDGFSEWLHTRVFTAAWGLTATAPVTELWASVLHNLLRKCQPGSFDPTPVMSRWYFQDEIGFNNGFFLRKLLADLLTAGDDLLESKDPAIRESFYQRFDPAAYEKWPDFAKTDGEHFFNVAMDNEFLWRTTQTRRVLKRLCWAAPDPDAQLLIPSTHHQVEKRMRVYHPEWFADENAPDEKAHEAAREGAEFKDELVNFRDEFKDELVSFRDQINEMKSTLRLHTWLLLANTAGILLLSLALRGVGHS